ncbi:jacalin-like lectin [Tateyamaria sp. ANG-S1]|uniref:jacalin-like lectin n=1 Tax=Tateyamaria sp. ANG-S1 TaxID=1577905 RepID=UPI00057DC2D5|nr:jacalin-like lectin [Tateyamaria sp. ANG-S1]KIC50065.1 hypothetical protein RA29_10775 [Tateyamaria sp. ANG-S1]
MSIQTVAIGGDHGEDFDIEHINSIGFRASDMVEGVRINGTYHGDVQGKETVVLNLQQDEYINELVVYESHDKKKNEDRIRGVQLTTNLGRSIKCGTFAGPKRVLKNIRVLGIGGNAGHMLFKLRVYHISDYVESAVVETGVFAVTNVIPQGQTYERLVSSRVARMDSTRLFFETVTSVTQTSEAGVALGEFSARASTTFGLTVTTQAEFNSVVEEEREQSEKITYAPPANHVGIEVVVMDVFEAKDGTIWFFPTSEPNIISAAVSGDSVITADLYDMTGVLELHLPYMSGQTFDYDSFAKRIAA